jgi:REP element-mobilizing transposase RayT
VTHHGRPELTQLAPVHVALKVLPHVWNLRSQRVLAVVESALEAMKPWCELRVVHFSIQGEHLHFIVEADDNRALSEGMQGLSVRLAKGLNRLMGRHGKVFADRFHAHVLTTPTETRSALAYVLLNHRSHVARIGKLPGAIAPDRFSSAAAFEGWQEVRAEPPKVTAAPRTWLLKAGWRRRGRLSLAETPAAPD